jgi:rhodanese-related sulfurtransferase
MQTKRTIYHIVLVLVAFSSWLVGCAPPAPSATDVEAAAGEVAGVDVDLGPEVEPEVVADLNAQGTVTVIDVREDWEYEAGHVPGAMLIPLGALKERVDEVSTDATVILVCRSGNRSGQAYRYLRQQGFENVHNMTGGMIAWEAAGLEME